jgi:RHS repeat-associated protein
MPSLADSRHGKRRPRALSPTIVSMSVRPQRNSPNQKTLPICHYDESWIHLRQQSATCPNVQSFGSHLSGKERDTESGNDYFGARYHSSSMGRFMSPDPSQLYYADPANPQSMNLYAYAPNKGNNKSVLDPKPTIKQKILNFVCKNSSQNRIIASMEFGAVKGVLQGGFAEATGGAFFEGVGAAPGALIGGFVGGIAGAGGGVLSGGAMAGACSLGGTY